MDFKFLRGDENRLELVQGNNQLVMFQPYRFNGDVEFCFQFNDDEPIIFGNGPNDLHIHITPTPNGNITFTSNNHQTFKIFARERE
jgi:hypothetical protein